VTTGELLLSLSSLSSGTALTLLQNTKGSGSIEIIQPSFSVVRSPITILQSDNYVIENIVANVNSEIDVTIIKQVVTADCHNN